MTLAPDHEQAIAYLLIEIRDLRVHLDRAEEHIAVIMRELAGRERRIQELEAALREIAEHEHCNYGKRCRPTTPGTLPKDDHYWHGYTAGTWEGHRCAAEIARKYLEKK